MNEYTGNWGMGRCLCKFILICGKNILMNFIVFWYVYIVEYDFGKILMEFIF